tara:strand:- start:821 stop:1063 length:243 start_codon:yes stop_codon:yes gene_type:complete
VRVAVYVVIRTTTIILLIRYIIGANNMPFSKSDQSIIDKVFDTPLSEIMVSTEKQPGPYSEETMSDMEVWALDVVFGDQS